MNIDSEMVRSLRKSSVFQWCSIVYFPQSPTGCFDRRRHDTETIESVAVVLTIAREKNQRDYNFADVLILMS
jgi:hypothetical protein